MNPYPFHAVGRPLTATVLMIGAACAPVPPPAPISPPEAAAGLPPVREIDGPLAIGIVHPPPGTVRPNVDSIFLYGSVGTGRATLAVNGYPVEVHPNGAFLGFIPRPADDTLRLVARSGAQVAEATRGYRAPAPATAGPAVTTTTFSTPQGALVATGRDTVSTGSDVAIGRPTPTGTYRWFLPRGARLVLTGERGDMVRARLDAGTEAWFPRAALTAVPVPAAGRLAAPPAIVDATDWTDVRFAVNGAPFQVEAAEAHLDVTLHGISAEAGQVESGGAVVRMVDVAPAGVDATRARILAIGGVWGYKAFYDGDGSLVVRVRRAPPIDASAPLRGIRILVDPGHPPGGAPGPTGLAEAEANLGISLRLAEQLRIRGAEVTLSRTTNAALALNARVDMAVATDAHLLVSVHNNAFPEGVNPFRRNGTSTYYFHPFSADFARIMNEELVAATQIRDLGALSGNLALVRPTWMPSVLTESLFMPIPEQEAALRNPIFLEQLAAAHVRGIERFLRSRAPGGAHSQPVPR